MTLEAIIAVIGAIVVALAAAFGWKAGRGAKKTESVRDINKSIEAGNRARDEIERGKANEDVVKGNDDKWK